MKIYSSISEPESYPTCSFHQSLTSPDPDADLGRDVLLLVMSVPTDGPVAVCPDTPGVVPPSVDSPTIE